MMKGVTIIEENQNTSLIPLSILNQVLIDPNIYKMPSFLPAEVSNRALVEKYQTQINYTGSFRAGYIYNRAIAAARLLEQQQYLFDAVSENEKTMSPLQIQFMINVFHKAMPLFLRSDAAGDQGNSLTFFPLYRYLGVNKLNGEVKAKFGIAMDEFSAETYRELGVENPKPLPYVIYTTPTPRASIQYAYILARDFQEKEKNYLAQMLENFADRIKPQIHHLIQAILLKRNEELGFVGTDFVNIKHTDPHDGFVYSAQRAYLTTKNEVRYTQFSVPFKSKKRMWEGEFSLYKQAIIFGEVFNKVLKLKTAPLFSPEPLILEQQLNKLMNLSSTHYLLRTGKMGSKMLGAHKIIELRNNEDQTIVSALIPADFFTQSKLVAYLFQGSLVSYVEGEIYQQQEQGKILWQRVGEPSLVTPSIMGGAIYYPNNQMLHFIDSFRNPLSQLWLEKEVETEPDWEWLLGALLKFIIIK